MSFNPAVLEDAQEPWGGAVTAICRILHQPGRASLLLHVPPSGEVRGTKAGSLRPPHPVGVTHLILDHFQELEGAPFKCQSSVPEGRRSGNEGCHMMG